MATTEELFALLNVSPGEQATTPRAQPQLQQAAPQPAPTVTPVSPGEAAQLQRASEATPQLSVNDLFSQLNATDEDDENSLFKTITDPILSVVEPALSIATGALAAPVAGLHGITSLLGGGTPSEAGEAVEGIQEGMTFQPRSEAGQRGLELVGKGVEEVATRVPAGIAALGSLPFIGVEGAAEISEQVRKQGLPDILGSAALEATGSPALAAAAATLPEAALELLGFKGANRVRGNRRITGIPDNVESTLITNDIDLTDLSPENIQRIQDAVDQDLSLQNERADFLRSQGLEPTQAQITRLADDFMEQQEIAKGLDNLRAEK